MTGSLPLRPTLRMLLMERHEMLYGRAFAAAERHGYGFVTPAMARLFIEVAKGPTSVSELARRLAISRQALHETVLVACERGLITLAVDPNNQRVRLVRFTAAGKRMSRTVIAVDRALERELARRIGADNVKRLKEILALPWGGASSA
jgi:DNA-binding MarR family transcriptional regulator